MKKILIPVIATMGILLALLACEQGSEGFPGKYNMHSFAYDANLKITRLDTTQYKLLWTRKSGATYHGIGIERDSLMAAFCLDDTFKLMAFRKYDKKRLSGIWITPDEVGLGFERTKKTTRLDHSKPLISGIYELTGKDANGTPYKGKLTVNQNNLTYTIRWDIEDKDSYFGIGFGVDKYLICGYASVDNVGLVMYRIKRDTLDGVTLAAERSQVEQTAYIPTGTQQAVLIERLNNEEEVAEAAEVAEPGAQEMP